MKRSNLDSAIHKFREYSYRGLCPSEFVAYLTPAEVVAFADAVGTIEHLHHVIVARREKAAGSSNPGWTYVPKRFVPEHFRRKLEKKG